MYIKAEVAMKKYVIQIDGEKTAKNCKGNHEYDNKNKHPCVSKEANTPLKKGISCISEEESSRISLGMCSPLREEKNGQITAKKRSKPGIFPVGSCAPAQQC
ncbi:hypothetical protein AgCh_000779 [Apium graveolens]